jgi:chromate transporter
MEKERDESDRQAPGPVEPGGKLVELGQVFLRLGTTAFGGPAAHLAMMQEEVVNRRKWLSDKEFFDMYAAANFIPGPTSTETAIHIGYRRAGWRGLLVAGSCFILPAAVMCAGIAALYQAYGQHPVAQAILQGIKPVVIAIVVQALFRLGKSAVKSWRLAIWGLLAAAAIFWWQHEIAVLFATGALVALGGAMKRRKRAAMPMLALTGWRSVLAQASAPAAGASAAGSAAGVAIAPLWPLFLVFLKIGAVLFGSGYVLIAFLRNDLVMRYHWLTEGQLLDAVAVGQVTPGPVFTTATFIGYVVGGPWGAVLATVGIFLPGFVFVAISGPVLARLRKEAWAAAFLDGLNVASLALMAVVSIGLAIDTLGHPAAGSYRLDWMAVGVMAASLGLLFWKSVNSVWLVLAGAGVGLIHVKMRLG